MPNDELQEARASDIAAAVPDASGDGAVTAFCAVCPNWIEVQFQSRIPQNMSKYMAIGGLTASDIRVDEAGLNYVVTDVDQETFEKRGAIDSRGFARIDLPSDIREVKFAFGSERPDDILSVPEGEQPGERASDEHWAVDIGRGALTGIERGINGMMRAADDFGFWVGWNPGMVKVDGEWVWMNTQERAKFFETYGYPDFMDLGLDRPGGTAGQVTEGITQFLIGFIPAVRAVRLVSAARVIGTTGTYMAAGVIADATVFDPHEQRLADLVQRYPRLRNPVTEFLASDPSDSSAEGRLKNALEGLVFGAVLDRFVAGLRVMRSGINRMVVQLRTQYLYIFDTESVDSVIFVLLRAARAVEPQITSLLQSLATRFDGRMVGLEFRFKSEDSLARKIWGEVSDTGRFPSQVAENIKDVLRYTTVFPDHGYVAGVRAIRAELAAQGYREVKFKNTWGHTGYKGINAVYESPQGFKFELQFHTNSSHQTKEVGTHSIYERQRILDGGPENPLWEEYQEQMDAIFDQIPTPSGAVNLE